MLVCFCKEDFIYNVKYNSRYRINKIRDEGWLNGSRAHINLFVTNSLTLQEYQQYYQQIY